MRRSTEGLLAAGSVWQGHPEPEPGASHPRERDRNTPGYGSEASSPKPRKPTFPHILHQHGFTENTDKLIEPLSRDLVNRAPTLTGLDQILSGRQRTTYTDAKSSNHRHGDLNVSTAPYAELSKLSCRTRVSSYRLVPALEEAGTKLYVPHISASSTPGERPFRVQPRGTTAPALQSVRAARRCPSARHLRGRRRAQGARAT